MNYWKSLLCAALFAIVIPLHADAATTHKHVKKHHHKKVHTTAVHHRAAGTTGTRTSYVAPSNPAPKTVPQKAASHVKSAAHKVSYNAWRLTHPHQARAESAAERSADSAREAADRAHEAQYKATHH
jgi:hypothetical protein